MLGVLPRCPYSAGPSRNHTTSPESKSENRRVYRRLLDRGGHRAQNAIGGACSLLHDGACSVYPDRPSICRTYPLFRRTRAGVEEFLKPKLLAEGKGVYGRSGTVDLFMKTHDADTFVAASERYFNLVREIIETLGAAIRATPQLFAPVRETLRLHYDLRAAAHVPELIDVDRLVILEYCRAKKRASPADVEGSIAIHIAAIEERLAALKAAEPARHSSNAEGPGRFSDTQRREVLELAAVAGAIGAAASISANVMPMLIASVLGGVPKSPREKETN